MEVWLLIGALVAAVCVFVSRTSGATKVGPQATFRAAPHTSSTHQSRIEINQTATHPPTARDYASAVPVSPARQAGSTRAPAAQQTGRLQPLKNTPGGRFIILDFETTGLSPAEGARVIEVSAREVIDGRAGEEFLTFVDPGVRVPAEITQITGITTQMLKGSPKSFLVMRELAAFIGSSPVVGHNVGFDRKFLEHEADAFLEGREVRTLCTLLLARRVFPGRASYRLGSIVQEVGVLTPDRLHRASADTWVTAHLFDRICEHARSRCGSRPLDHDLLDRLQRVKIATAHHWLSAQGSNYASSARVH
jgi:DNA polymerase-3 subunit epsilon